MSRKCDRCGDVAEVPALSFARVPIRRDAERVDLCGVCSVTFREFLAGAPPEKIEGLRRVNGGNIPNDIEERLKRLERISVVEWGTRGLPDADPLLLDALREIGGLIREMDRRKEPGS